MSNYSGSLAWNPVHRKLTSPSRSTRNGVSVFQINIIIYRIPLIHNVSLTFRFTNKRIKRLIPFKNKMMFTKPVHIKQNITNVDIHRMGPILINLYIIRIYMNQYRFSFKCTMPVQFQFHRVQIWKILVIQHCLCLCGKGCKRHCLCNLVNVRIKLFYEMKNPCLYLKPTTLWKIANVN